MLSTQSPSRLRLITLLIPPSHDPLLTPYQKQINPKILPLKRSLSILSNIRSRQVVKQQTPELSKGDYQKINRSYQSLKKFKKKYDNNFCENDEQQKESDPQYLSLIQWRKSILIKKKRKQAAFCHNKYSDLNERQTSFLGFTQPIIDRSKCVTSHMMSGMNTNSIKQKHPRYFVQQKTQSSLNGFN